MFAGFPVQAVIKYGSGGELVQFYAEARGGGSVGSARFESDWLALAGLGIGLEVFFTKHWGLAIGPELGVITDGSELALPLGLNLRIGAYY